MGSSHDRKVLETAAEAAASKVLNRLLGNMGTSSLPPPTNRTNTQSPHGWSLVSFVGGVGMSLALYLMPKLSQ